MGTYTSMSKYVIGRDYSEDEANSLAGRSTVLTSGIDTEFVNLKAITDALVDNLLCIQRTDGKVADAVVEPHTFSAASLILIASTFTPKGSWVTATAYEVGDIVDNSSAGYVCVEAHTSGTFSTDLAADKWNTIAQTDTTYSGVDETDTNATKDKLVSNLLMKTLEDFRGLLTTRGDILVKGASANERLAKGAAGQILVANATDIVYREIFAREQKVAAYTVVRADGNKLVDVNASAATRLITLPRIDNGEVANGWPIWIRALDGSNQITISRAGLTDTFAVNGGTSITLNQTGECICLVADSDNNKWVLASDNRYVGASIGRNANQTVATGTPTKMQCNVSNRDPQGIADISTNYRLTVAEAGIYQVRIQCGASGALSDGNSFVIEAYVNGSAPSATKKVSCALLQGAIGSPIINASGELKLAATDYVELFATHNQGGNVDLGVSTVLEISKTR